MGTLVVWLPLLLLLCSSGLSKPLGRQANGQASIAADSELLVQALNGYAAKDEGIGPEDQQWDGGGAFSAFAGSANEKVQVAEHIHQEQLAGTTIQRPASAGPLPAPPPRTDRLGSLRDRAAPAGTAQHLPSKNGGQPDEGQPAEMPQMQAPIPAGPLVPQQPPMDPALMIRLAARNDLLRDGHQAVTTHSFRRLLQTCEFLMSG
jgi:hypothetical protein